MSESYTAFMVLREGFPYVLSNGQFLIFTDRERAKAHVMSAFDETVMPVRLNVLSSVIDLSEKKKESATG